MIISFSHLLRFSLPITLLIIFSRPTLTRSISAMEIPFEESSPQENTHQTILPLVMNGCCLDSWVMAGANPERTSWVAEEVRGQLNPIWSKQFEPYIQPKVQIVATYGNLYVSTSKGLYTIDANTGAEIWVYPTEMPLGHSPTIHQGVAYVGGFDKRLHAVDAYNGQGLWTFSAGAGFDTNPLVVEDKVYTGNRDGNLYAVYTEGPNTGKLAWKYKTGGPINFSAAYKDGVVFFASDDSYAYALEAQTGKLVWKSTKLPGAGFQSWWPVIYGDWVIFSGSTNFRPGWANGPGPAGQFHGLELDDIYPNNDLDPTGTLIGPLGYQPGSWVNGTPTINTSKSTITTNGSTLPITEYLEEKPWRRTYFVLERATGNEYNSDFDNDGQPEYAPILWQGTQSGNRYPPVIGSDGVLYQANNYMSNAYIAGGQIAGWEPGTPFISVVSNDWNSVDEPIAYSAGGDIIYWNLCCDREAGAFDILTPNLTFAERYESGIRPPIDGYEPHREWKYFNYNLDSLIAGYSNRYYQWGGESVFGGRNGVYGPHGNQNPPIPYLGKVFMHRSNAVIAFSVQADQPVILPTFNEVEVNDPGIPSPTITQVKTLLANEVVEIIDNGHFRPGYIPSGFFEFSGYQNCGDRMTDYWHNSGDVISTLIRTLPHLPDELRTRTIDYLETEFSSYPPYQYTHIGWKDGLAREIFDLPPEIDSDRVYFPPEFSNYYFDGWDFPPQNFYAMWKFAAAGFGDAKFIFDASKDRLEAVPSDAYLMEYPHVHNAYIAGYLGYLKLEKLAGYTESINVRQERERLMILRAATFSKDAPDSWFQSNTTMRYCRALSVSHNFLYLVPELGQYLRDNALETVQEAIDEYEYLAPYWFVSKFDTTYGEGVISPLYDYHSIFKAKALIMKVPHQELIKYLDIPAVAKGDLYFLENLITALEAWSE